ncbi:MAG: DUF1972 domain-containing protein [Actinobacteria bacterium]|nr:DUF1972 domain-containing protein [Actinomycetota bacterium]MBV9256017.1 DUF1972 domain-containing protein [Actinomycetota bacterium]
MKIAMLGCRGVPARYGGFETVCEEVGSRLVQRGHDVVVYCRNPGQELTTHAGMQLVNLPAVRAKAAETLSHTALSAAHAIRHRPDVAVMFNTANSPVLPLLRAAKIPVALVSDGLEWRRAKWGRIAKGYSKLAERYAVRWPDRLIVDSRAVGRYFAEEYGATSEYISYGAHLITAAGSDHVERLGFTRGGYNLVVARLEPENNVDLIMEGYRQSHSPLPLVIVGGAPYASSYRQHLQMLATEDARVRMIGPMWDGEALDQLYAHAALYLHGHSVGGTNPSLLRAMGAGRAVVAFDVDFNREVLAECGRYFADAPALAKAIDRLEQEPEVGAQLGPQARARVATEYVWDDSVEKLEAMCLQIRNGRGPA